MAFLQGCAGIAQTTINPLCDKNATEEAITLYYNLQKTAQSGFLFGHQDDLAYGVNWRYEPGRSDVKDVTGDYPGVYGWDLGGLEKKSDKNLDGIPFDKMRQFIIDGKKRGGIITLSWHLDNPLTGKNAWDTTPKSMESVLPGGASHEKYKSWLDEAAKFMLTLKDDKGKLIPILYRPFHELTGDWFWWCKNNGSPEQFKALWKFTVDYYRMKGLHNLIYVYNTSDFVSRADFLEYYPGADYADVLSFDTYEYSPPKPEDTSFIQKCQKQFAIIDDIAKEQHKLIALAETGLEQIPYEKWWTDTLVKAIGQYKISYVLVWRNHGWNEWMNPPHMHYYAPYKGQVSEEDFVDFYNLPNTFFEKDAKALSLYKK
ncbi:glycosyl hydrolase [Flavobacterium sp.]|uniref:glycoside hydrolase family 26 protein n=2 Tax=unclassified Flavobacterium TaxID=196869 RepID=UPI002634EFD8|nr:glycosyl hydrolase [Flavobacterium sp.]